MIPEMLVQAVVSGLVGGVVTGVAVVATLRVDLKYLRRDVDYLLRIKLGVEE